MRKVAATNLEAFADSTPSPRGVYYGSKWGIHLRAPDIFFEILAGCRERLLPLARVADIQYGIKSGADKFFYVTDVTEELFEKTKSEAEFYAKYGLRRQQFKTFRLIRDGLGAVHRIEARFLRPIVITIMGMTKLVFDAAALPKRVVMVSVPREQLKGSYVGKYIAYGEQEEFDETATCQGRVSAADPPRPWYDLAPDAHIGHVLWPKAHQYRHLAAVNREGIPCNCRLYSIRANSDVDPNILAAILNSTFVALFKEFFGRFVGNEGNTDTMVMDVEMMLVPDPRAVPLAVRKRMIEALEAMFEREIEMIAPMGNELEHEDRKKLDDAVLEGLGLADRKTREEIRHALYDAMTDLYRHKREKELIAMANRLASKGGKAASARELALQIFRTFDEGELRRFPEEFGVSGPGEEIELASGEVYVGDSLFTAGAKRIAVGSVRVGEKTYDLGSIERCEYVAVLVQAGRTGKQLVPNNPKVCRALSEEFRAYWGEITEKLREEVEDLTSDTGLRERVLQELAALLRRYNVTGVFPP